MVKSMFAAVAGLRAHQSKMDVIGNNIANVNTYGYKTARAAFRDVFYATTSGPSDSGEIYGGTNPMQVGYGSKLSSIDSLMTTGGGASTDNPTDCMIMGNGFFLVGQHPKKNTGTGGTGEFTGIAVGTGADEKTPKGSVNQQEITALQLTRVGIFNFDGAGNLVDSNGRIVYGFESKYDAQEKNYSIDMTHVTGIKLPNKNQTNANNTEYEPLPLDSISIGKDGVITGKADNGEIIKIGKIAIANVPNPNALLRGEDSYYSIAGNTGTVTVNPSGQNATGYIQAGYLEMSNVDLSREFTDMITTQRGYQANTRIITVTDAMLEELVNMKR